jgi:hypothetical protein
MHARTQGESEHICRSWSSHYGGMAISTWSRLRGSDARDDGAQAHSHELGLLQGSCCHGS